MTWIPLAKPLVSIIFTERFAATLLFEPRDLWIGVYWTLDARHVDVYVCALPVLPVRFRWALAPAAPDAGHEEKTDA